MSERASECHSSHHIYNSLLRMRVIHELKIIVFDASAKYEDVSYNEILLQAPKLQNGLLTVWPCDFKGNITKMYMRIKLKPDDQDVNTKGGPDVFDRAVFKVNSSLFLEQFDLHGSINLFPLGAKRVFKSTQIVSVFDKETGN